MASDRGDNPANLPWSMTRQEMGLEQTVIGSVPVGKQSPQLELQSYIEGTWS